MMTEINKEIVEQCIKVYACLLDAFARTLKADKRYAFAKGVTQLRIQQLRDIRTADAFLRDRCVYDPKHPNKTAPAGFYPLLGLAMHINDMHNFSNPILMDSRRYTFHGAFAQFNMDIQRFIYEVGDLLNHEYLDDKVMMIYSNVPELPKMTPKRILKYKKRRDGASDRPDAFYVKVDRCTVRTWKFGIAHQCVVEIQDSSIPDKKVEIGLRRTGDAESSLEKGIVWAEEYLKGKTNTVERVFADCFENWPDLYQSRERVIDQLFFTIGGGYRWLDGAIISTEPEAHLEFSEVRLFSDKNFDPSVLKAIDDLKVEISGKQPDRQWYPASEMYSNICHVPNNVKDDWMLISYEAATLLANDTSNSENARIGRKVLGELEQRFEKRLRVLNAI